MEHREPQRVTLTRLSVRGFRNLHDQTLDLDGDVNVIVGRNGHGKTSILEAVYVVATGRSFRRARGATMIRFGDTGFGIDAMIKEKHGDLQLGVTMENDRRRLLVGGLGKTLGGYTGNLPAIAVTAERMEIVRGGPEERRRFIDRGLLLDDPDVGHLLRRLDKTQKQKNALLSDPACDRESLAGWNRTLAEDAARIRRLRRQWVREIGDRLVDLCQELGRPRGVVSLQYSPSPGCDDDPHAIEEALGVLMSREINAGRCLAGPARDELEINVDGRPARTFSSAGEQKAIVLGMKLAKIQNVSRRLPLLLLDDLDAELDRDVLERFLRTLPPEAQTIATSAKAEWIGPLLDSCRGAIRHLTVEDGAILPFLDTRTRFSVAETPSV